MRRIAFYALVAMLAFVSCKKSTELKREADFNFDWKFTLIKDTLATFNTPLKDADWRDIRLPHDWSVEASFDSLLEGATGYLPGGVAWYQKHFKTPIDSTNQKAFVLFDGVYNNAKFWLNGHYLGENPYGYSPVYFDLTNKLNYNGLENILSIYVDRSRYVDSRWYPGSGIYRNVKLITTKKLHIPIWGTYLTTPKITNEKATVHLEVSLQNDYKIKVNYQIETTILDTNGKEIASIVMNGEISGEKQDKIQQELTVRNPKLWDVDQPTLYKAVTQLYKAGELVDRYETPFGFRTIEHNKKDGLLLNGKRIIAKGVCLHHDGGLVGAAVPKGVWKRRLQLMKEAGVNAIRTSHNPFSEEFLDLCDEMGFLVQAEIFDEFDYAKDKRLNYHDRHDDYISRGYDQHFQKWGKSDLTRSILRDRNHPSIFEWSIGNEIEWTYLHYRYATGFWKDPNDPQNSGAYWGSAPILSARETKERYDKAKKGKYILAETAKKLNNWVKELDTTRPTTANLVVPQTSLVSGYADALDLVGFSYRNLDFPWAKENFPHKQFTINECPGSWEDWKTILEHDEVYSMYMWTGVAYLGEAHEEWPKKVFLGDLLNLAGFKNQGWNYFKSIWVDEPHISLGTLPLSESGFTQNKDGEIILDESGSYRWRNTDMHWNYKEDEAVLVEVNTNQPKVELFLNDKSLGIKKLEGNPDNIIRWVVPFKAGKLVAKTQVKKFDLIHKFETASKPKDFTLTIDKKALNADGYDVAHCIVQLIDEKGRIVKTENRKVTFKVVGYARILGVDNGLPNSVQDFQSNSIVTGDGRCLMILQSKRDKTGTVIIKAFVEGLKSKEIEITIL